MIAVDTNVLLRLLTGDDERQAAIVLAMLETTILFVPLTVTMETEWVLRTHYRWSRTRVVDAVRQAMRLDGIVFAEPGGVDWALGGYLLGSDFDDLIHVVAAGEVEAFATFDRNVARYAAGWAAPVITLGI